MKINMTQFIINVLKIVRACVRKRFRYCVNDRVCFSVLLGAGSTSTAATASAAAVPAPVKHKIHSVDITHVAVNFVDNVLISTSSDR